MNSKLIISAILLVLSITVFGQDVNDSKVTTATTVSGNNEVKFNLLMAISGIPELNYERLLTDNMGIGFAVAISLESAHNMTLRSMAMPYCRLYFGSKKAAGFFIEANMALVNQKETYSVPSIFYTDPSGNYYPNIVSINHSTTSFGFGTAVGVKFLARHDFVGELYVGLGRLFGESIVDAYPRVGITLGKRF